MRGRRVLGWAASMVFLATASGCGEPAPIEGRGYRQVWADQFNYANQVELGAVWELNAPFTAPPDASSITFRNDGGARYVRLLTGAYRNWEWSYISTAGPRRASPEPNYTAPRAWEGGYFEARIRYSPNQWAWPSFWLFSKAKTENWPNVVCPPSAPLNSEFDILDSGRFDSSTWTRDHYHGAIHRNTPANGAWCGVADQQYTFGESRLAGMDLTQWHVWSGRWIQRWDGTGQACTYVDGIEIGCNPTFDTTNQPMVLNFTIQGNGQQVCTGCVPPAGTPDVYMDIDWVRVMQL